MFFTSPLLQPRPHYDRLKTTETGCHVMLFLLLPHPDCRIWMWPFLRHTVPLWMGHGMQESPSAPIMKRQKLAGPAKPPQPLPIIAACCRRLPTTPTLTPAPPRLALVRSVRGLRAAVALPVPARR